MEPSLEYIIPPEEDGWLLRDLLRRRLTVSAALLRKLKLQEDGILLDGRAVTVRQRVCAGQRLRILTEAGGLQQDIVPVAGPLDIVFEDEHLLIVNKPADLPVHPSRGHYCDTLANRVVSYFGGQVPFRAVNRLDRGTSGLLCLAKTQYSAQQLGRQMAARAVRRTYLAVVEGIGLPPRGTIDLPIGRVPGRGILRAVRPDGDRAVTHYRVLDASDRRTRVEIRLETGRTHQIRVHFAHMGHPVTGDFMYGRELPEAELPGQALHAAQLALAHPLTGQAMHFAAPAPDYFARLMVQQAP